MLAIIRGKDGDFHRLAFRSEKHLQNLMNNFLKKEKNFSREISTSWRTEPDKRENVLRWIPSVVPDNYRRAEHAHWGFFQKTHNAEEGTEEMLEAVSAMFEGGPRVIECGAPKTQRSKDAVEGS